MTSTPYKMPDKLIDGVQTVVFAGESGSGKSFVYKKYAQEHNFVCHDELDVFNTKNMEFILSQLKDDYFKDVQILPVSFGLHGTLAREFTRRLKEMEIGVQIIIVVMITA